MARLATAAVLAPLLWLLIREAPPGLFFGLALPVLGLCCWECYRMFEKRGARPFSWLGVGAAIAMGWTFIGSRGGTDSVWPLAGLVLVTSACAMWRRAEPQAMLETSIATVFPVLFVGLGLGYVVGLRAIPGEDGQDLLLLLFFCVTMADTGAFYVGSHLGRRRLAPLLSPKKSWEGAAGGLAASVAAAVVAHAWFYQRLPLAHALTLGVVLALAAIVGDLAESMVKRASDVKDSSGLLPGHGGMLDRLDSLLFAAPVLYYYYRIFLQGPA